MKIKIVENTSKDSARELMEFVKDFILHSNHTVVESVENADMIISLGGDGTILRTWRDYGKHRV